MKKGFLGIAWAMAAAGMVIPTLSSAQDRLVAVDSAANAIYTLNRQTGAKTFVANIVGGPTSPAALAHDRVNNVLYLSDTITDSLYTLDPTTGVATLVGNFGLGNINMHGLEFDDSTGTLYGTDWNTATLYTINPATAAPTAVGPLSVSNLHLVYDSRENKLFAISTIDRVYEVNRATAGLSLVGPTLETSNPTGSAFDWSSGLTYTVDNSTDELYALDLLTGRAQLVGSTGAGNLLGLAFIKSAGQLWAVDSSRALFTVDPATGAKTAAGTVNAAANTTAGLAYDRFRGIVYLTSTGNDNVYRLDLASGNVTLIGNYGNASIVMHGLEYDEFTDRLFGVSSHNNGLYEIDRTTGLATLIGTSALSSFTNLGYNSFTDTLFATNSGTDNFHRMNRVTGGTTLIGALGGPTNPNGLAFSYMDGKLYLVDNSTDQFYTINMATGAATSIGAMGAGNLLGLAYVNPTPANHVTGIVDFGQLGGSPSYFGPLPSVIPVSWRTASNNEFATGFATYDPATGRFYAMGPQTTFAYRMSFKWRFWLRRTIPNPADPAIPMGSHFFGVTSLIVGDIDEDNEITNGDYAIWASQNGNSVSPGTGSDLDGDGDITNGDYALWAANNGILGDD